MSLKQTLLTYYHDLAPRDQKMLRILAIFLILVFGYSVIWHPLHAWRTNNYNATVEARALKTWMTNVLPRFKVQQTKIMVNESILTTVEKELQHAALRAENLTALPGSTVSLQFDHVNFSQLITFLNALSAHNIAVSSVDITREDDLGKVKASLQVWTPRPTP